LCREATDLAYTINYPYGSDHSKISFHILFGLCVGTVAIDFINVVFRDVDPINILHHAAQRGKLHVSYFKLFITSV
jgi:hypothetical protein